jgi:hypothetical protein
MTGTVSVKQLIYLLYVPTSQGPGCILTSYQDLNKIQQAFSAEKHPTLWRALPLIEELQTAWEKKRDDPCFARYHKSIYDGLAKLNKYYSRFDEKPVYIRGVQSCTYFLLIGLLIGLLICHLFDKENFKESNKDKNDQD